MGNNNEYNRDAFFMHIKFIGSNIDKFLNTFNQSEYLKQIKTFWNIDPINLMMNNFEQINAYFFELKQKKDYALSENRRECLVLKINNLLSKEVNIMLERMNDLEEVYLMPIVLLLTMDKSETKLNIDCNKYDRIDPRLIYIGHYTENKEIFEEKIAPVFVRFCSIHNELGDRFDLGIKGESDFDLIKEGFPFNMNIACIGRFGQGKSSGVNSIINEYKAKESSKGCSQTKNMTYYQIEGRPIRILDIPGFESEETVKKALEKLKFCGQQINQIKDNIHIILYFLNYSENRAFMELEYPIIEEIIKQGKKAKLIYVITHSKLNPDSRAKNRIIDKINSGIYGITKNKPIEKKIKLFKADNNNVVFVNFYKDNENKIPPFGKYELFKKIRDFFINSESYKQSQQKLSEKGLQDTIEKLKAEARQILLPNKIWGAAVGIIPFADWMIQKFIIKKNAIKKVGNIFGIDLSNIEKEIEEKKKIIEKQKNKKFDTYKTSEIDAKYLMKADYNELNKESNSSKVKKAIQNSAQTTAMAQGAVDLIKTVNTVNTASQKSINAWKAVEIFEKTYGVLNKTPPNILPIYSIPNSLANKYWILMDEAMAIEEAEKAFCSSASSFSSAASVTSKALGLGSMIIGIAISGYTTHRFCEELIDKFANYYKENGSKIKISYDKAISYFEIPNDAQFKKICNSTESLKKQEKTRFSFDKLFLRKICFALLFVIISIFICRHLFHLLNL